MLTNALQRRELKDLAQGNDYNTGKFGPGQQHSRGHSNRKSKDWFVAGVAREANSPNR